MGEVEMTRNKFIKKYLMFNSPVHTYFRFKWNEWMMKLMIHQKRSPDVAECKNLEEALQKLADYYVEKYEKK